MRKTIIKSGDKFGKLTAVRFSHRDKHSRQFWLFKCDCGNEKVIMVQNVKSGATKACGCLLKKHGLWGTKAYWSWAAMKDRCLNKNNPEYKHYGGREITVCDEWFEFENFFRDMGIAPKNKSLDRKENNGNYCKSNCRWATREQQDNNTSRSRFITFNNKTQTITQWARELEMGDKALFHRINRGWSIERALTFNI